MNPIAQAYVFLCRCLSPELSGTVVGELRYEINSGRVCWKDVLTVADSNLVTPTLWFYLNKKNLVTLIPADLCQFLREIHCLNLERNEMIRSQARELIGMLNSRGVEPLILKGGLHLFHLTSGDLGSRIM